MRKNITSNDSTLEKPCVGNDNLNYLWMFLLSFGLEDDGVDNAKESIGPSKVNKFQVWKQCELKNITG